MATTTPELSVIVPIYNADKYLKECIDSIITGEYKNLEIILIDDGSKDNSPAIADEYAAKYPDMIKVIHQNNQGQIKATKNGIAASTGKYIGFVDSDDWVSPIMYRKMMEATIENDADIVSMAGVRVSGTHIRPFMDALPSGIYDRTQIEADIIPNLFMNHDLLGSKGLSPNKFLKIFKRTLVDVVYKMIPDDIVYGEDLIFSYTAIAVAQSIIILPQEYIGYNYRLNPNSVSWVYRKEVFKKSMKIVSFLRALPEYKDNKAFQSELNYTSCFFAINSFLNEYLMKNDRPLSERKEIIREIINTPEIMNSSSQIKLNEAGFMNRTIAKLIRKQKLNSICFIGILISIFRKPITKISQKVF